VKKKTREAERASKRNEYRIRWFLWFEDLKLKGLPIDTVVLELARKCLSVKSHCFTHSDTKHIFEVFRSAF
jgi:hypothetical protein